MLFLILKKKVKKPFRLSYEACFDILSSAILCRFSVICKRLKYP